jgi:hypothetical protein
MGSPRSRGRATQPSRAPSDPSCKPRANQRDIRAARPNRYIAHVLGDG